MSDKTRLLREADEAFAELHQAIDGLPEEQLRRVWLGTWGVREILIHVSGWHREMIPAFERLAKGEPAPFPPGTYDDFDAWNARFVERKTGAKVSEILAELDSSHQALVGVAAAVSEPHFDSGWSARDLFEGVGPGHYREHTAQIREWRQTATR